ncbi:MAG TPA: BON domain-containing protein [Thermoanaerobaculia bacterium]|jgi:hyperosmotically inducible protein
MRFVCAAALAAALPLVGCASTRTVGEEASDAAITAKVKARLAADPDVKARRIDVDTLDGRVRLGGVVDSRTERAEAVRVASRTEGVLTVDNDLRVGDPTVGEKLDDETLGVRVKAALIVEGSVKARDIDVDVVAGVVTLSGEVESREQKQKAAEIASRIEGVERVYNRLVVAS